MKVLESQAMELIFDELRKAKAKWPKWVDDPIHAAGILVEESGELMQAALDFCYADFMEAENNMNNMIKEAAQVGAMAIRFIEGVQQYERVQRFSK